VWVLRRWRAEEYCSGLFETLRRGINYDQPGEPPGRATGWLYLPEEGTDWPDGMAGGLGEELLFDASAVTGFSFRAVCFQGYLEGAGVDWHTDANWKVQAIMSLGATRPFGLRKEGEATQFYNLDAGDLLLMTDLSWEHCVRPGEGERISVVFRA
jgi:alkylated DNA repair dioxygenase AlkB